MNVFLLFPDHEVDPNRGQEVEVDREGIPNQDHVPGQNLKVDQDRNPKVIRDPDRGRRVSLGLDPNLIVDPDQDPSLNQDQGLGVNQKVIKETKLLYVFFIRLI